MPVTAAGGVMWLPSGRRNTLATAVLDFGFQLSPLGHRSIRQPQKLSNRRRSAGQADLGEELYTGRFTHQIRDGRATPPVLERRASARSSGFFLI